MTGRERGSVSVEFALVVPVLVLLFGLVVGGARTWMARAAVEQAATAAARGVSQARDPGSASRVARELAAAQAAVGGLRCLRLGVTADATALSAEPGAPGMVSATVSCEVPLGDVLVPGWPGVIRVEASAESVVDRFRGRK